MTKKKAKPSAAVAIAKGDSKPNEVTMLSTGIRARLLPVPAPLLDQIGELIPDPEIPIQFIEDKDRHEPNPFDPTYLSDLKEAHRQRSRASLDAFIMFGVELVDKIPPDAEWLPKLRFMEKRGALDLSCYDMEEEIEREFVYKNFIATGSADLIRIGRLSGVNQEEVRQAADSFRREAAERTDPEGEGKE